MSDLFHENVTDEVRDRIFAVMGLASWHTYQVLTKRPENMLRYLSDPGTPARVYGAMAPMWVARRKGLEDGHGRVPMDGGTPMFPNVWLGVSVENQAAADERIPLLLQTPAAVRFLSCEPLLNTVSLRWKNSTDFGVPHPRHLSPNPDEHGRVSTNEYDGLRELDWVICGGESGPGARPMHPDWARSLRDQCQDAGVPYFFKQWGEWAEVDGGPPNRVFDVAGVRCPIDSVNCVISLDGHVPRSQAQMREDTPYRWMSRVGKKAAGAMLDGREWKQFPGVGA